MTAAVARLAAGASVLSACVLAWRSGGDQTLRVGSFLALFGAAFVAYLIAVVDLPPVDRRALRAALGLAIVWRLVLVSGVPLLSDDVYRHVWEGRIQHYGGNPFRLDQAPAAERWTAIRDDVWERVNHKEYSAIYPPLWQLLMRGVTAVSESTRAVRLLLVGFELLLWWAVARALDRRGRPPERLLILAWNPLAMVEIAGSGHNDGAGVACLAVALWALDSGHRSLSALALACGFHVKLLPALVGLAWWRHFRPRDVAAGALLAAGLYLPFASAGTDLVASLFAYGEKWRFNASVFPFIQSAVGGYPNDVRAATAVVVFVALACGLWRLEPVAAGAVVVTATLVLSPNLLPWYALWLLPFLAFRDEPALLLFTGTVSLAYLVIPPWQSGEPWRLAGWIRALEYVPCAAVAVVTLARFQRSRST